jgi:hypothetical protein
MVNIEEKQMIVIFNQVQTKNKDLLANKIDSLI